MAFRLVCTALLAAISLQVSEPLQSLEVGRGSAFSATTYDVAISPSKGVVAKVTLAPLPATPVEFSEAAIPPLMVPALRVRPDSTGPPARAVFQERYAPRAPPVA